MRKLITNDKTRDNDALRLVLLYAIRYEKHSNQDIRGLSELLRRRGISDSEIKVINKLTRVRVIIAIFLLTDDPVHGSVFQTIRCT